jgi:hypothetical protein
MAADSGATIPDFSGQWGRDMLFFEPPPSGPGPVINAVRKADGTVVAQDPCCTLLPRWLGDHTSPILKPEAAAAVKKFGELASSGSVTPDLHNSCWPEPPPYVMGLHFGVLILQQPNEVTLLYLLYNTVRRVRLDATHPEHLAPSCQGHSVGRYEGDTLVVDTVGIKVAPYSTVDPFGTPHSDALHVVERYRLIDGEAAAEAQKKHGAIFRPVPPYGRGTIDPDTAKNAAAMAAGNYVEFHMVDGRRPLMRTTLASVEAELAPHGFVRTHRSWLVNAACVRELKAEGGSGDHRLELEGRVEAPLSRRFPQALDRLRRPV